MVSGLALRLCCVILGSTPGGGGGIYGGAIKTNCTVNTKKLAAH